MSKPRYDTATAAELLKDRMVPLIQADYEAQRLQNCGLVYHERQINGQCWIGPPERHPSAFGRVKVLPLSDVVPRPNMLIHAHGEKYQLPHDFKGTWFDVVSPTGKELI